MNMGSSKLLYGQLIQILQSTRFSYLNMNSQLHCVFSTCLLLEGLWTRRNFSFFIFQKDLAQSLLLYGRAEILTSSLLQVENYSTRIRDGNQDVDILRRDIKYLEHELGNAE